MTGAPRSSGKTSVRAFFPEEPFGGAVVLGVAS